MRTATVLGAGHVSMPGYDDRPAIQVDTTLEDRANSSFYMQHDAPEPAAGASISWDDRHVIYAGMIYRKLGYSFDNSASQG